MEDVKEGGSPSPQMVCLRSVHGRIKERQTVTKADRKKPMEGERERGGEGEGTVAF